MTEKLFTGMLNHNQKNKNNTLRSTIGTYVNAYGSGKSDNYYSLLIRLEEHGDKVPSNLTRLSVCFPSKNVFQN